MRYRVFMHQKSAIGTKPRAQLVDRQAVRDTERTFANYFSIPYNPAIGSNFVVHPGLTD